MDDEEAVVLGEGLDGATVKDNACTVVGRKQTSVLGKSRSTGSQSTTKAQQARAKRNEGVTAKKRAVCSSLPNHSVYSHSLPNRLVRRAGRCGNQGSRGVRETKEAEQRGAPPQPPTINSTVLIVPPTH